MNNSIKKTIADLKFDHHSLNKTERHVAIEKLAATNTFDAARELIQIFYDSQWRETKMFIIKNIVKCSNQRTFEFLIDLVNNSDDIPMAEQVIKSLGLIEFELARKYLVQYYKNGAEHLKPAVVLALAEARDRQLVQQFVTDLEDAYKNKCQYLTKNLIYAVGELKCKEAKKQLIEIIQTAEHKDLLLSALIALGKITRDLNDITIFEMKFSGDTFEYQIYQNVKNQVMLRSNWKAEDYLQKVFEEKAYHPAMPLELNTFSEADVRAGLDLFATPDKQKPLFDILAKVGFSNTANWYKEFLSEFENVNFDLFKSSLSYQHSDSYLELINSKRDIKSEDWLYLVVTCLPSADKVFAGIFSSNDYKNLSSSEKIVIVNQFVNWGMIYKLDNKKMNLFEKQLEALLFSEPDIVVQSRLIRAFAQMSFDNSKVNSFVKQNLFKNELISSYLFYFDRSPSAAAVNLLECCIENELISSNFCVQIVKALSAQSAHILDNKKIENYILNLVKINNSNELRKNLNLFLAKFPFAGLKTFVLESLKNPEPLVQLNAVIALKSYSDGKSADDVAKLLQSPIESIRGRALDTLLVMPGLRSRRLAFDYFLTQIDKPDVVEQICRRFEFPESSADYFFNKISELVGKYPNHSQIIILTEFKEKLFVNLQTDQLLHNEKRDTEVLAMDIELSKKISGYNQYDETAKSALRSAELPFVHPEMYSSFVDKSASILGYSKALDIILEKHLGRKILFPRLETRLHEFQNIIHLYELNDMSASFDRVVKNLSLEKYFNQQTLPLHKMCLVGQGILSSKIINEHFKILDGLRAWAVILLLFARKTSLVQKPLIRLGEDEQQILNLCKKLMWLQDLRNPVAHRQTLSDFKAVEQARNEVIEILSSLDKLLK